MRLAIEGSTWINPRGYGRFTRELTRALVRIGSHHTITLVLDSGAAAAPDLPNIPRVVVPTRRAVVDAATVRGSRSPADVWRMTRALSAREFDAVLFPTIYSFVPVISRAHVTVVVHDALPEMMPQLVLGSRRARLLWRLKRALACRRAGLLGTVSKASAREMRARLRVGSRPILVLTEGAAMPFSPAPHPDDPALVRQAVPCSGRIILYVGGLSPHKRVPALIHAFGTVAADRPAADLTLALVGPTDRDGFAAAPEDVAHAIAGLGSLAARVIRVGFVPDSTLAALYRAALCVVLPSAAEGFGLPALEAMACGAPVIVSRTPALEELCGDAAEYADDPNDLAPVLARLVDDERRSGELARAGPLRAARFDWDTSAHRLLDALDRTLSGLT